jgi:hypothetical protein
MDVGKQVVEHIEFMYPDMVAGAKSWKSARLSIRNCTHNAIIAAVEAADKGQHEQRLKRNDEHRRDMQKLRKATSLDEIMAVIQAGRARRG